MMYRIYSIDKAGNHHWLADFAKEYDAKVYLNKQKTIYIGHMDFILEYKNY